MIATQDFSILSDEKTPTHLAQYNDNRPKQARWHKFCSFATKLFSPFIAATDAEYRVIAEYPH